MKRFELRLSAAALLASLTLLMPPATFAQDGPPSMPKMIAIEVLMIETHGDAQEDRMVELTGPSDQVVERVRELQRAGKLDVVDQVRLTTLEGQIALVQIGRTIAVPTSRSGGFGDRGPTRTSYQSQSVGTLVSVTTRVEGKAILAEIKLEKSDLEPARQGAADAEGGFQPTGTQTTTVQTTVSIPNATTVTVGGMMAKSKQSVKQVIVLASASIIDAAARAAQAKPKSPSPAR